MSNKQIILDPEQLKDMPLFFRKIFFNQTSDLEEENKLCTYSNELQSTLMRDYFSYRQISKTINFNAFKPTPGDE